MAHVARLRVFPIKSLDGHAVSAASLAGPGSLHGDRVYAMCDPDGEPVNGKRDAGVHRILATHNPDRDAVTLARYGEPDSEQTFSLDAERGALNAWLAGALDRPIQVIKDTHGGHPDDTSDHGPTLISTATLRRVADWIDRPVHEVRRRFRANVEIGGVAPFWEDRLYDIDEPGRIDIGGTELSVTGPLRRCVVPTRHPDTGEAMDGFRATFVGKRRASRPAWASAERLAEHYRLAVTTAVPEQSEPRVSVGDAVQLLD